jgi:N-hydroxyarylamine O-acetyltransferase
MIAERRFPIDVDAYLARIGFEEPISVDHVTLAALQRAHLQAVPFENLDVVAGVPVRTDLAWSIPKIVDRGRGGWCFELNGAFGALLDALGFDVSYLGAAVLLDGPNVVIDHLVLEVRLDTAWLVDVGFGDSFFVPLDLNRTGPQDGGNATYEFLASPQGTTLAELDGGVPAARFRFKRVAHQLADFDVASEALQADSTNHWHNKPFATRLLDEGSDRVTLLRDRLKIRRAGVTAETELRAGRWPDELERWFGIQWKDHLRGLPAD